MFVLQACSVNRMTIVAAVLQNARICGTIERYQRVGGICCPHPQCQRGAARPHIPEDNILRHIIYHLSALKLYMLFSFIYRSFCLTNIVCHFLPPFHRARGLSDEWARSEPTGNGGR